MALGLFHFQLLHQILERVHFVYDEHELGESVLQNISEALNAEGGSIFDLKASGDLIPVAAYGVPLERLKEIPFTTGRGVVGWVVQHAQPVKVDFPGRDTRFVGSADAATGFKTRNIIAAPIMAKGQVVGVIEFLNKREGAFTLPDLELLSMVGREVGIAVANARLIRDLKDTQALVDGVTDSLAAGILVVDQNEVILRVNSAALKILGSRDKREVWAGRPVRDELSYLPEFLKAVDAVVASSGPLPRAEVNCTFNGQPRVIGYSGSPVMHEGKRLGSALLFQDITSLPRP